MRLEELNEIPPWEWPNDAATLVLDALANPKTAAKDRLLAAELAGELVILDETIGKVLLSIVNSENETTALRAAAAIALGPGLEEALILEYDDEDDLPSLSESLLKEIQSSFQKLYNDASVPADLRRSVLEASVRFSQDWHPAAIQAAYASESSDWKLTAVFCMQHVRGFENQILESLKSNDHRIVYHAIKAAGTWELDAAWQKISRLVTAGNTAKNLRLAAIEAAASIRPSETEILEPLVDSDDDDIAEAAMDALAEAGLAEAWGLETDDDWDEEPDEESDSDDEDKRQ